MAKQVNKVSKKTKTCCHCGNRRVVEAEAKGDYYCSECWQRYLLWCPKHHRETMILDMQILGRTKPVAAVKQGQLILHDILKSMFIARDRRCVSL